MSDSAVPITLPRVRTPTVVQFEAAECGAAALSILLAYHGRYVPLEELRYQCGVSRDGCDAYNLVEAARHYGLETEGYRLTPEELIEIETPFIVFWRRHHFLVLEGIDTKWVYVNDPATGPRRMSYSDFVQGYSGIAIEARPGPSFHPGGTPPRFWPLLWERTAFAKRVTIIGLIVLQLTALLIGLMPPAIGRVFLDNIVGQMMISWKWGFYAVLSALVVFQMWSGILRGGVINRLRRKLSICMSVQYLWHVLRLPLLFFTQRYGSEIMNRMGLNTSVSAVITGQVAISFISILLIVIYALVMLQYDIVIAVLAFITAGTSIALMLAIARMRENAYGWLQQDMTKSVGLTIDALQHIESVKTLGAESFFFNRVISYSTKNLNNQQNIGEKDVWLTSITGVIHQAASIALLAIGGWRIMEGHLSVGMLLALQILMGNFLAPVSQLVNFGMQLQTLKIDMTRLDDVLKAEIDVPTEGTPPPQWTPPERAASVEVRNLTFGYSPLDNPLFKDLNLQIRAGDCVALVGATGSGKSTLAKILCRLFRPWGGTILFDGLPQEQWPRELIQKTVSWVDQEIVIFGGTIRDNITLWNPHISDERIMRAASDACIHEHIMTRQYGYDSVLNEGGNNMSQGQKQRLELARALLHDPKVLILDEAMSALDPETELTIFNNIKRRGCTCLTVTHRLATAKLCDTIIVMDKGKIVQEGRHSALKRKQGVYASLIEAQGGLFAS